jgi:glycosyltransferase involved in cell wall biosynthesis
MKERGQSRNSEAAQRDFNKFQYAGLGLVSIIIPCYNQAHFLNEAIESVLAQSYPHFEIIVVDDGSIDNTSEVAVRYPEVRCIRQDNQGVNAARNTGLRHSKGEYLVFLDADDRLLPGALKAGLECFDAHPECALVAGHCHLIATDGASVRKWRQSSHIVSDLYLTLLSRKHWVNPGAVMQRRAALEYVGDFDPSISASEDYDLYFRIARKFPVYWHNEAVMEYRLHDTNTTRNAPLMLKGTVEVLRSQRKYVKKDRRYKEAYKAGMRKGRKEYGEPLVEQVRAQRQKGEWERAMRGTLVLLRYYPQGLALLVNGRRRLSQQLKSRSEQLRNRERQLRELRSILKEERRKLGRVRKQNQQLVKSERNLLRQLQEIRESKTWRLLQGVNRIRAKALRK